jgi:hypothetical protein
MTENRAYPHFTGARHALYVGWVAGIAMRHGMHVEPVTDDAGNHTDQLRLTIAPDVAIAFIVPPPPPEWSLTDGN